MKPTKRHQTKDKENVAAPVAHSSESEHGSEEDSDGDHTDYERERLENIRRNQEIMRQLSLPQAAADLAATSSAFTPSSSRGADRKKRSAPTPGVKREKRVKNSELLPRRKSNRLANIDPEDPVAKNRQDKYIRELETLDHARRERRTGNLSLSDVSGHGDEAKFAKLMEEMATYVPDKARVKDVEDESDGEGDDDNKVKKEIKEEDDNDKDADKKVKKEEPDDNDTGIKRYFRPRRASTAADKDKGKTSHPAPDKKSKDKHTNKEPSLRKRVQALRIRGPWPTVKVCQGRVYCMAIHENKDKVLVCGGDIDGNLGFWDLDESQSDDYEPKYDEEPNIYSYKAHTRTLSSMQYSPTDPTKLFTTSYDGSVRYLDLIKQQFIESYVASPDVSDHLGSISLESSGHQLWFADNDGAVTLKDVRTPKDEMVYRKVLHEKKVGCVNVNPKFSNLIVTSSLDRTMKIWDVRTFGKYKDDEPIEELAEFPHGLSVTSAMWSPDGVSIASTSYDDNVRIFNNFDPALPDVKEIPEPVRIRHNNRSGRWVTMLRAVWSPQFNWFSIGNMNKSVDIYSRGTGDLMANLKDPRNLTTVPAVNAWHPNRVLIASGMANGKMVIWR
ncbi:hypothetical protein BG011_009358 [Mortierella polycephala]|uniref:DNA damage-binding protein CMR1 n=1 Tax=Mortierella polycephala TaxID=41804 RepID=A0A9P6QBL2_9FUNG|nr:hypothetical protein BG011_009358 [Mortierella polycephala]